MIKLGEKIKLLRKQKNISQEVLANYLGVSFQAVSKWENGSTMPDVAMIPAIAAFFKVSTDELFDFKLYETEKNIEAIIDEHSKYWDTDKKKAEQIIRNGLKQYPGNDILLNCLIGVLSLPEQSDEIIAIAKSLVECTKYDDVRFDAYRIMAEAYKSKGEYQMVKSTIDNIPELYFSKLEIMAQLLEDNDMYEAAQKQKNLSADTLTDMLIIMGKYLKENGDYKKAAIQLNIAKTIAYAFSEDDSLNDLFKSTLLNKAKEAEQLLNE